MVTDEADGIKRVVFPSVPAKNIPGFQFNYNEERLLKVRENIMHSVRNFS